MQIPVLEYAISDGLYVDVWSIVEDPATETQEHQFSKLIDANSVATGNQLISCVIRADHNIIRQSESTGALYYVRFSKEVCNYLMQQMLADLSALRLTFNHDQSLTDVPLRLSGLFQKSSQVHLPQYEDVADGSIFATFDILDDSFDPEAFGGVSVELNYDYLIPADGTPTAEYTPEPFSAKEAFLAEHFNYRDLINPNDFLLVQERLRTIPSYNLESIQIDEAFPPTLKFTVSGAEIELDKNANPIEGSHSVEGPYNVLIRLDDARQGMTYQEARDAILNGHISVHCTCKGYWYWNQYANTMAGKSIYPCPIPAPINNPNNEVGGCKHIACVLTYYLPLMSAHIAHELSKS